MADVRTIIEALRAEDEQLASDAEGVVEWLTAGESLGMIDLAAVQRFAWYELPVKWLMPPQERHGVLKAAGELFDRLGLDRYAAVCRSPETAAIVDTYEQSHGAGLDAFRTAWERSGIDPPDLDGFAWGDVMGGEEATAQLLAARALEEAMVAGRFTPGKRGWKAAAQAVTAEVLDGPHLEIESQTYRTAILTERLDAWLRSVQRSPRLFTLRSRHVNRLLSPVATPPDVVDRMTPVTWILDRVADSVTLTQAGYLPTAMVRDASERFEWTLPWADRAPRTESELGPLRTLHEMLRDIRAVQRRGRGLRLTQRGERMRRDPEIAWREMAAGFPHEPFVQSVAELMTWFLLDGEKRVEVMQTQLLGILADGGWGRRGGPLEPFDVGRAVWGVSHLFEALGASRRTGSWSEPTLEFDEFSIATLTESIRIGATGPRSSIT